MTSVENPSESIVSFREFHSRTAEILREIAKCDDPIIITQNGLPAAALLSPHRYYKLTKDLKALAAETKEVVHRSAGRLRYHANVGQLLRARFEASTE